MSSGWPQQAYVDFGLYMWKKILAFKEIIAITASVVAVVAGIVGVVTLFATKGELKELRCETFTNLQLGRANTGRLEAEQAIFNAKVTLDHLTKIGAPNTEVIKVNQIISIKETELDNEIKNQNDLANHLNSGACKM